MRFELGNFLPVIVTKCAWTITGLIWLGPEGHYNPISNKPQIWGFSHYLALFLCFIFFIFAKRKPSSRMMTATSSSLIQRVCSVPLARAVRTRSMAVVSMNLSTTPAPSQALRADSRVLLGLSEPELQQLALDLKQVKKHKNLSVCLLKIERCWIYVLISIFENVCVAKLQREAAPSSYL